MKKLAGIALALVALVSTVHQVQAQNIVNMQVRSEAFADGSVIPNKFANWGDKVQPDFTIIGAPAATVTYAIIFHDMDVTIDKNGTDVTHWVAFDIPSPKIEEGKLPAGSVNGGNTMRQSKYFGPGAPLPDRFHHYMFEFYALDTKLGLPEGASRADVMKAMEGHVIGKATYGGRYAKVEPKK